MVRIFSTSTYFLVRRTGYILAILFAYFSALANIAMAESSATYTGTTLASVLRSSAQYSPVILEAQSKWQQASHEADATDGAFDPYLESSVRSRLTGFYGGTNSELQLVQPLADFNTKLFAAYRISDGRFPIYEDEYNTLSAGEFRLGFALSLWRDRDIDKRRFNQQKTQLDSEIEWQQLRAKQFSVQHDAYIAYAQWLFSEQLREAYQALLNLAKERGQSIQQGIKRGEKAPILQVENDQTIYQRQALLIDAQAKVRQAAQSLALYFRDDSGQTKLPSYHPGLNLPIDESWTRKIGTDLDHNKLIKQRPEIIITELAIQQAMMQERLALNSAKPRLDLSAYTARDIGNGSRTLNGTDNIVQLKLELPLRTREADGKSKAARAKQTALEYRVQQFREQLRTDLAQHIIQVETAAERLQLAMQEVAASQALVSAEEKRFESGNSDLFVINVRERTLAEAQLKRIQSQFYYHKALADYYLVTMDSKALGLESMTQATQNPTPSSFTQY